MIKITLLPVNVIMYACIWQLSFLFTFLSLFLFVSFLVSLLLQNLRLKFRSLCNLCSSELLNRHNMYSTVRLSGASLKNKYYINLLVVYRSQ